MKFGVYVLFENPEWMPPLRRELKRAEIHFEEWFINKGHFDLSDVPPEGVFLNRISPSSHTRDHTEIINFTREMLIWLESNGRRVINGSHAFSLEISKVRQYQALREVGLRTPHTIVVSSDPDELKKAAISMPLPFLTKHNCGGKGLGIRLFHSLEEFDEHIGTSDYQKPVDSILLLQEYIESPDPYITRVEMVGEKFLYAINSNTSQGFELCPAEGCDTNNTTDELHENVEEKGRDRQNLFSIREDFFDPIIDKYKEYMRKFSVDIAGFEFIETSSGEKITYDVNGTTNYSPSVEERHGLNGMAAIAKLISRELKAASQDTKNN